ncbi:superoxide dismutase, partial [Pantoea stewartii]
MKVNAIAIATLLACGAVQAASEQVTIHAVSAQGIGNAIGTVNIEETQYGLQLTPMLEGLKPGIHGFHVHAKGSCEPGESEGKRVAAGAAGGHLDPANTGKHLGPYAEG